jgi:hypothetical protein
VGKPVDDVYCMETWIKRIALIFAVFCGTVLTTIIVASVLMPGFGLEYSLDSARMAGWALSPFFIWLYVRTWENAPRQRLSLGSTLRWTVGMTLCIGIGIAALQSWSNKSEVVRQPKPGARAFHEANLLITSSRNGINHGNTPQAKELAGEFSSRLKVARQQGVEARKSAAVISATGGEFLTFCHMTDDHCIFLVHVPDLRKFSVGAKDYIADAALSTAVAVAAKSGIRPAAVAVGIRGALLYDRALSANLDGNTLVSSRPAGQVKGNDECTSFLAGYFTPPPVSKTATRTPATNQPTAAAAPVVAPASPAGVVSR